MVTKFCPEKVTITSEIFSKNIGEILKNIGVFFENVGDKSEILARNSCFVRGFTFITPLTLGIYSPKALTERKVVLKRRMPSVKFSFSMAQPLLLGEENLPCTLQH